MLPSRYIRIMCWPEPQREAKNIFLDVVLTPGEELHCLQRPHHAEFSPATWCSTDTKNHQRLCVTSVKDQDKMLGFFLHRPQKGFVDDQNRIKGRLKRYFWMMTSLWGALFAKATGLTFLARPHDDVPLIRNWGICVTSVKHRRQNARLFCGSITKGLCGRQEPQRKVKNIYLWMLSSSLREEPHYLQKSQCLILPGHMMFHRCETNHWVVFQ